MNCIMWTNTLRIYFTSKFESIRVCQIGVGSGDGKNDSIRFSDVLENHVSNLLFDILRLISHRYLCKTRKIDECEGEDVGRENSKINRYRRDARVLSGLCVCSSNDFISYFPKVVKLLIWEMK